MCIGGKQNDQENMPLYLFQKNLTRMKCFTIALNLGNFN